MITYQEEPFTWEFVEEFDGVAEKNSKEIDLYQDKVHYDPDFQTYVNLSKSGLLSCITVRDEGKLVGYCLSSIMPNPHYKNNIYAVNDVIYIKPEYRGTGVGKELLQFAENTYKEKGASVFTIHMKENYKFEELLDNLGFDRAEVMYSKCIED